MEDALTTVLITRPEPRASDFARRLRQAAPGRVRTIVSPLLRIEAAVTPEISPGERLVLTSSAPLGFLGERARANRALCVGQETTRRASASGLRAQFAGRSAAELARRLESGEWRDEDLHYLRGETVARDLAAAARRGGARWRETVTYAQHPEALTPQARAALSGSDRVIAPVFSAATARILADAIAASRLPCPELIAISMNVAKVIESKGFSVSEVIETPDRDAMLAALLRRL